MPRILSRNQMPVSRRRSSVVSSRRSSIGPESSNSPKSGRNQRCRRHSTESLGRDFVRPFHPASPSRYHHQQRHFQQCESSGASFSTALDDPHSGGSNPRISPDENGSPGHRNIATRSTGSAKPASWDGLGCMPPTAPPLLKLDGLSLGSSTATSAMTQSGLSMGSHHHLSTEETPLPMMGLKRNQSNGWGHYIDVNEDM